MRVYGPITKAKSLSITRRNVIIVATAAAPATGAATVLGPDHSATRAFARAAATMDRVDLWRARLALKTLRRDQRQAIAEAVED